MQSHSEILAGLGLQHVKLEGTQFNLKKKCLSFILFCDEADLVEFFEVSLLPVCNRGLILSIHEIS